MMIDYNLNNLNVLEPLFGGEGGEFSFSVGDSIMITELIGVEVLRIHICFRHSFGYRASASSPLLFPPSAGSTWNWVSSEGQKIHHRSLD